MRSLSALLAVAAAVVAVDAQGEEQDPCTPEFKDDASIEGYIRHGCPTDYLDELEIASPGMTSLLGAGALTFGRIKKLEIEATALRTLEGLNVLRVDELHIKENPDLESLQGLNSLTTVFHVTIYMNPSLTSLLGLHNVRDISSGLRITGNPALRDLSGLTRLRGISGMLRVEGNNRLETLVGLDALTQVWGTVDILANPSLRSFLGFHRVELTRAFVARQNGQLETLGGLFGTSATYLKSIEEIHIDDATWPRCVTPQERDSLCRPHCGAPQERASLVARQDAKDPGPGDLLLNATNTSGGGGGDGERDLVLRVPEATWERWLHYSCGPGLIECWRGMPCPRDLGYDGTVVISSRTCGPCRPGSIRANSSAGQPTDLAVLLSALWPKDYSLCRCQEADPLNVGPVAQVSVLGPVLGQSFRCMRGTVCGIEVLGNGLQPGHELSLRGECIGRSRILGRATMGEDGTFHMEGGRNALAKVVPNEYRLCWSPPSCANSSVADRRAACPLLDVGALRVQGPFHRDRGRPISLGQTLTFTNSGENVSRIDRLLLLRACGTPGVTSVGTSSSNSLDFTMFYDPAILKIGRYQRCWCQPSSGNACNRSEDFVVSTGTVTIACPMHHEPISRGGSCRPCPPGKVQEKAEGVEPCEMSALFIVGTIVSCVVSLAALGILTLSLRNPIYIEDVATLHERTIVRAVSSHRLRMYGRCSFPVRFCGTTHPLLDSPKQHFRATWNGAASLQLLNWDGSPVDSRLDTSMGYLYLPWHAELWHRGWPLPVVLLVPLSLAGTLALQAASGATSVRFLWTSVLVVLGAALLRLAQWKWRRRSSLSARIEDFRHALLEKNPQPTTSEKGPSRAIQLGKLFAVLEFFSAYVRDRPAYYMDGNIFGPLTKPKRLSYAELAGQSQVDWFVSHFWGDPFVHLCKCLRKHAETVCGSGEPGRGSLATGGGGRSWDLVAYWVCFVSNNQYQINDELGSSWQESSFFLTLQSGLCQGVCMVLDDHALPLTRAWCIFEVLQTLKLECSVGQGFQGLLLCTQGGVLNFGQGSVEVAISLTKRIADLDLENASASCASDKAMICEQVVKELGSFDRMNDFMRLKMHAILKRARTSANESFEGLFDLLHKATSHHLEDGEADFACAKGVEVLGDYGQHLLLAPACAVQAEL